LEIPLAGLQHSPAKFAVVAQAHQVTGATSCTGCNAEPQLLSAPELSALAAPSLRKSQHCHPGHKAGRRALSDFSQMDGPWASAAPTAADFTPLQGTVATFFSPQTPTIAGFSQPEPAPPGAFPTPSPRIPPQRRTTDARRRRPDRFRSRSAA